MKKPIYNIFTLTARNIILTLALVSAVQSQGADGEVTTGELSAKELEGLKLQLVSPMTSGAETLTGNDALERYFVVDGSNVIVHLNGLAVGQHRLTVKMQYGTQVEVLAVFDIVVPANLAAGDDEREVQISAVKTIGDGSGVQITVDQEVIENSPNPVAGGAVYGALEGKQPAGTYADGTVYTKPAEGHATIADDKVILGAYPVEDESDAYALIVGNGADAEHQSNAFAITRTGDLVLFNNETPVVLTPAKLAQLIA